MDIASSQYLQTSPLAPLQKGELTGGCKFHVHSIIKILLLLTLIAFRLPGQSGMAHFYEQGNQAYREGNYQSALEWYGKILSAGYESSQVYYNIGNCYYKLGAVGRAILFYEKARKLNPRDREILFNLELANLRVIDRIETPPQFFLFDWWEAVKTYFTVSQLTRLAAILFGAAILALIGFLFFRERRVILSALIVFSVLALFSAYLLVINAREENTRIRGIVLVSSVNVLSAPNENSTDVFVLHEGVKVTLQEQRGEWALITLPDGKSGWMKRENLGII